MLDITQRHPMTINTDERNQRENVAVHSLSLGHSHLRRFQ